MLNHLIKLFNRDLDRLSEEVKAYKNEENLWETPGDINNSAGNLVLHLCGNLNHFIGAKMGNTGYIRKREKEFSQKNIPVKELLQQIEEVKKAVTATLENMDEGHLAEDFEIPRWTEKVSVGYWLIHLTTHLNYHLGQINYHRRLFDN